MKRLLKQLTLLTFIFSLLSVPLFAFANSKDVARVIILRGSVKAKIGSSVIDLKKGMWLKEGAVVQTANRSFCKLLFIDKSQMSLGPKSQMQIKTFPKNKAGIISLLKGQLRSKVSKDYMNMKKDQSKLFIKTKTAAMGVRGTDFQVNYNPANMVTSLVTFEGAVAMARLDERMDNINQHALENIVSSRDAVIVTKGHYSGVDHASPRATVPTKINPAQLESLKKTTDSAKQVDVSSRGRASSGKNFRNPIPPGVNSKTFANKAAVESKIVAVVGKKVVDVVKKEAATADKPEAAWAKKAAAQNKSVQGTTPKAGGFVDLKTALYIQPPKDSAYDPNTQTYIVPPALGSFDPNGGGYVAPEGKELTDDGRLADIPSFRAPASVDSNPPPVNDAPPVSIAPPPSEVIPVAEIDPILVDEPLAPEWNELTDQFENPEEKVLPEGYGQVNFHISAQ